MFGGSEQVRVEARLSWDDLLTTVEGELRQLRRAEVRASGRFVIEEGRDQSFLTQVRVEGEVRERRDGRYEVRLDYQVAPSVACWVLGILGFLCSVVGGAIFLAPF